MVLLVLQLHFWQAPLCVDDGQILSLERWACHLPGVKKLLKGNSIDELCCNHGANWAEPISQAKFATTN